MKEINFLGLGFEVGQTKSGLKDSHQYIRTYFSLLKTLGLSISDRGEIMNHDSHGKKVHSAQAAATFNWSPYQQAFKRIYDLLQEPEQLLNWGGDHSVALASVGAFTARYPDGYVLWIDAHTDINLPEHSLSGNLHGMPLAILLNIQDIATMNFPWLPRILNPEKIIYVGVRDLDPFEKEIVQKLNITAFTAHDIRQQGMPHIAMRIMSQIMNHPLHVSFDIDCMCPQFAPSTGVPVAHGLTIDDVKILGRALSHHQQLRSVDVVEINPSLGNEAEVFQTYYVALSFLISIFQGGIYDGIGRSIQTINPTSLEQSLSV